MRHAAEKRTNYVIGPNGFALTPADLPSPDTKRWIAQRKAEVVTAVLGGLISMSDACERYKLSSEEFLGWDRAYKNLGIYGLRASSTFQDRPNGTDSDTVPPQ